MEKYDVAVVGGGPTGGTVAGEIAKAGFSTILFEEHKQIGKPLKCAGLVTPRVFDFHNFTTDHIIQNTVKGAHIHSPSDHILTVGGDKVHALVIDRHQFDQAIIKQAQKHGVNIMLKNRVDSAQRYNKGIRVSAMNEQMSYEIQSTLLVGADGAHSTIRKCFNFPTPRELIRGIGADITNTSLNSDFVEIFLGSDIAPGFFAWAIPTNNKGTKARIGLCIHSEAPFSLKHYFQNFLQNSLFTGTLTNIKITQHSSGSIPLGPLKTTALPHVMLVGDAAAQAKPTSGGGIYTGLMCSRYCATVAIDALKNKNTTNLMRYHKLWSEAVGQELSRGMTLRKIFKNLTDKQLDSYILKFNDQKLRDIITTYGDIDYPSKLILPLLKVAPGLLKTLSSSFLKKKKKSS
jgi:geranylgeranyl reductase family protein